MSNKKKLVRDVYVIGSAYVLAGPVDDAIATLTDKRDTLLSNGASDIQFGCDSGYDYTELLLIYMRPETDVEFNRRKKQAARSAAKRVKTKAASLERERAEYERLKRKFEME